MKSSSLRNTMIAFAALTGVAGTAQAQTYTQQLNAQGPAPAAAPAPMPPSIDNPVMIGDPIVGGGVAVFNYTMGADGNLTQIVNIRAAEAGDPRAAINISTINTGRGGTVSLVSRGNGPIADPGSPASTALLDQAEHMIDGLRQGARFDAHLNYRLGRGGIDLLGAIGHSVSGHSWLGHSLTTNGGYLLDGINERSVARQRYNADSIWRDVKFVIDQARLDGRFFQRRLAGAARREQTIQNSIAATDRVQADIANNGVSAAINQRNCDVRASFLRAGRTPPAYAVCRTDPSSQAGGLSGAGPRRAQPRITPGPSGQ